MRTVTRGRRYMLSLKKEMLTLNSLMVEPHIRRASSSEHDAAISKVIMLGKEWEPPPYKADCGAVSLPQSIDFCILAGMPAEIVVVVCVMEPCCFLNP